MTCPLARRASDRAACWVMAAQRLETMKAGYGLAFRALLDVPGNPLSDIRSLPGCSFGKVRLEKAAAFPRCGFRRPLAS